MRIRELAVGDAWEITPVQHPDDRGVFLEWYRFDEFEQHVGHQVGLKQANLSVSKRGVVRGIHYADVPPGQAKYVTVVNGRGVDYVVDLREGSPTFGRWDSVVLDDVDRRAVYLAEGLGHCFVALSDVATLVYLVSEAYNPQAEHDLSALDPEIALEFPAELDELVLSDKDRAAPSLADLRAAGRLPQWEGA